MAFARTPFSRLMTPILVFDIETIPDVAGIRRLDDLPATMSDAEVAEHAFAARREKTGSDFLPHHLQRIAAISCVFRDNNGFRVRSLGTLEDGEAALVQSFYRVIEKYTPQLVSWNGGGFDLPVLHYRSLQAQLQAPRYWETGEEDSSFRYNNYLSRFHWRHLDLMDVLAGFQGRARASLADVAALLGFPGKLGFSGDKVWDTYLAGGLAQVRHYCETDVLNTFLIYLRFQFLRGRLDRAALDAELEQVRALLRGSSEVHHAEFLNAWEALS